jgi:ubiquinone/menaquinone biosynthesis C-methylase UbiE
MPVELNNMIEFKKYYDKVDRIFDIGQFLKKDINDKDVIKYYQESQSGYSLFHSSAGSIHMAINEDGVYDKVGYLGQANCVQEYIEENRAKKVLELASGKGFNSIFLGEENPYVNFIGIDLTPNHIEYAQKKASHLSNVRFLEGNFQNLDFENETFDIVFEVESICHALNMKKSLSEAFRVLKSGGYFILFDGFRNPDFDNYSEEVRLAAKLTEISMAVAKAWEIDDWIDLSKSVGFYVETVDNISSNIMPNLKRLQLFARGFFKYPSIAKIFMRLLPMNLVQNAIAGIFMPFTISLGAQGYYKVILKKQ